MSVAWNSCSRMQLPPADSLLLKNINHICKIKINNSYVEQVKILILGKQN